MSPRTHSDPARRFGVLGFVCAAALAACDGESESSEPLPPRFALPDRGGETLERAFELTIDADDPSLLGEQRAPQAGPVRVTGPADRVAVRAYAKRPPGRPGDVWLELFVENLDALALRDVELGVEGASAVDVTRDPLATAPLAGPIAAGGIGPEGLGRAAVVLPGASGAIALSVRVRATTTSRVATSSSTIAVSPDGEEVWVVSPDRDEVIAIDTTTRERVAEVSVADAPASLAISPDGVHVLVASRRANRVSVVDRATREVVQELGERDGIPREPRHLAIASSGADAFVSGYVGDAVARLERRGDRYRVAGVASVGRRPTGLSVTPDGAAVIVAHALPRGPIRKNEAWLSAIEVDSMTVAREAAIDDAFNEDTAACLADVFGISASRMTMEGVATALGGAFLTPGGSTVWVPGMRVSPGPVMEYGQNHGDFGPFTAGPAGRFSPAFLFLFDAHAPLSLEATRAHGVLDLPDVNLDYVRCAEPRLDVEFTLDTPIATGELVNKGVANPNGAAGLSEQGRLEAIAWSRGGRKALAVSALSDELIVQDATTMHPASVRHLLLSGSNPSGIATSPDGRRAYVAYANSLHVSELDLSDYADALPEPAFVPFRLAELPELGAAQSPFTRRWLARDVSEVPELPPIEEVATIAIAESDPLEPEARLGRILFSSSSPSKHPTLSSSRQASCSTCHPDGGSDGSGWATVEGERRTMSLRGGVAGRGWLHSSATHANAEEFVRTVVAQRLGGSPDDATVAVLARHVAVGLEALQPPAVDEALAARGAELFAKKCRSCHEDTTFGSGRPDADDPLGGGLVTGPALYDLGTRTKSAGILFASFFESIFPEAEASLLEQLRGDRALGPADPVESMLDLEPRPERAAGWFKAPSLVGVFDQSVYFHDGRFARLEDVVGYLDEVLSLGLSDDERRALVEYVKTL